MTQSRFAKKHTQAETPTECIAYGCWLFPVAGIGFSKTRIYCSFHDGCNGDSVKRDRITHRMSTNKTLINHYYNNLRNKTVVELDLADKAGENPDLLGYSIAAKWNREPGEDWQHYKNQFAQRLNRLIRGTNHD